MAYLALAIFPVGAVTLLARAFYALGDYRTPVLVSSVALVVNIVLNWILVTRFDLDVRGLALATVATSWLSVVLLLPRLRRAVGPMPVDAISTQGVLTQLSIMVACALAAALLALGVDRALLGLVEGPAPVWLQAVAVSAATATAAVAYFGLAARAGLPQLALVRARLAARKRR